MNTLDFTALNFNEKATYIESIGKDLTQVAFYLRLLTSQEKLQYMQRKLNNIQRLEEQRRQREKLSNEITNIQRLLLEVEEDTKKSNEKLLEHHPQFIRSQLEHSLNL